MPSPAPSTKTTLTEYQESIEKLASKDGRFEPLNIFLSIKPRAESKIHAVHYSNASPEIKPLREDELETYLKDDPASTLFIVEDISRDTLALLGHHCKPDPQFFLDYLDVVKPTASTPKCSKVGSDHLTPLSWFRLGDIENHLPSLQSIQDNSNHITVRFVGPREYIPNKNATKKLKNINERIDSPDKPGNVLRLAGGHIPIHFKGQQLWEAAMNRTSTAAWFDSGTNWRKAIILLDPPLDYSHDDLDRQNSKYRSFLSERKSSTPAMINIDTRHSYSTSFQHHLKSNSNLKSNTPSPILILQDLFRIIASEWIAVNLYIERDLNAIEWRLQNNKDDVLLLEFFLKQLLILRRRTGKYESLVEDHLNLRYPSSWLTPSSAGVQRDLVLDLQQVRDMLRRNNERISQTVPLITSLMSVIEGKHATSISQQLTFLTVLATILLPFSIFASVFGMQTEYGPGESKFWVFLCGASLTPLVLACYVGFRIFLKVREKRAMAAMM